MRVLFIQGGSRLKFDKEGNCYTDSNFNNDVWKRYNSYFTGELHVILRKENKVYSNDEAKKYNFVDTSIVKLHPVPDLFKPRKNYINIKLKKLTAEIIEEQIIQSDRVIIRSVTNFYTCTAARLCEKYHKPYLIEVTGFGFGGMWYHGLSGKAVALPIEIHQKKIIKKAPYVLYVTRKALQETYPTTGKSIGCSDVELVQTTEEILNKRMEARDQSNSIIIGTAAFVNVKLKGQITVIKALSWLKSQGITNIEYQMVGAGDARSLKLAAEKYHVQDQVKFLGAKEHSEVFDWLDSIDLYVQPSYLEGLCRSIIEAMGRGCPVLASDVGGNFELIDSECLFKKGNYKQLAALLQKALEPSWRKKHSEINFINSKEYEKQDLDSKRERFYHSFLYEL
jgi:glycosyltransferase involved in cell wall biosynthesis